MTEDPNRVVHLPPDITDGINSVADVEAVPCWFETGNATVPIPFEQANDLIIFDSIPREDPPSK